MANNGKTDCGSLLDYIFKLRFDHIHKKGEAPNCLILNDVSAMLLNHHIKRCTNCRDFYKMSTDGALCFMEMNILVRQQTDPMVFHVSVL